MVAGDFNGANWRRKLGPQQQLDSTLEETFKSAKLPVHPASHRCGGAREGVPGECVMSAAL